MPEIRIQPKTTPLSDPYWSGCKEGRLRLQQCDDCERFQFYPRIFCSHCGHRELTWRDVSGRGRIASFTVVQQPLTLAYPSPSIIILVELEEGPRMMSSLVKADPETVTVGAPVIVDFEEWSDDISMPVFRIVMEENT